MGHFFGQDNRNSQSHMDECDAIVGHFDVIKDDYDVIMGSI